jgi:hypothetical protein
VSIDAGIPVRGPVTGGRERSDGRRLEWDLGWPDGSDGSDGSSRTARWLDAAPFAGRLGVVE